MLKLLSRPLSIIGISNANNQWSDVAIHDAPMDRIRSRDADAIGFRCIVCHHVVTRIRKT